MLTRVMITFVVDAVLSAHRSMSRQHVCMHVVGHISPPFEFWLAPFDMYEIRLPSTYQQWFGGQGQWFHIPEPRTRTELNASFDDSLGASTQPRSSMPARIGCQP